MAGVAAMARRGDRQYTFKGKLQDNLDLGYETTMYVTDRLSHDFVSVVDIHGLTGEPREFSAPQQPG